MLFTTFSRSLTEHLKRLYGRIPDAAANVEFINIDRVAFSMAKPAIDVQKAKAAFDLKWSGKFRQGAKVVSMR